MGTFSQLQKNVMVVVLRLVYGTIARWMHSQNQNFSELIRFFKLKKHSKMAKKSLLILYITLTPSSANAGPGPGPGPGADAWPQLQNRHHPRPRPPCEMGWWTLK
jgi:hypothetical protein